MWTLLMAWRSSKHQRVRLFIYMLPIIFGTASLVAIQSLNSTLTDAINSSSKELLGADFIVRSQKNFEKNVLNLVDSIAEETSSVTNFLSVINLSKQKKSRFVNVRGIETKFPFYGEFVTEPSNAKYDLHLDKNIILDLILKDQYNVQVGDFIKLGKVEFKVVGFLKKISSDNALASSFAPRVIIPFRYIQETKLIGFGSLVTYELHIKSKPIENIDETKLSSSFREKKVGLESIKSRQKQLGEGFERLSQFLSLLAFISLILGAVGISGAVTSYMNEKSQEMAFLLCLGATQRQIYFVYLIQILIFNSISCLIGISLGISLEALIPDLIKDKLPVLIEFKLYPFIIIKSLVVSLFMSSAFVLFPLEKIRNISPISALRVTIEDKSKTFSLRTISLIALVLLIIFLLVLSQTKEIGISLAFVIALIFLFFALYSIARLLAFFLKKLKFNFLAFEYRFGISNLFRPNNQSALMIVALGLGLVMMMSIYLVQDSLLYDFKKQLENNDANAMIIDIQEDQNEGLKEIVEQQNLKIVENVPIVTMRFAEIKGITVDSLLNDTLSKIPRWLLSREFRSSYRNYLKDSEELLKGTLQNSAQFTDDSIKVSVEESIASDLKLELGDSLVFNVQGNRLKSYVGSIRKVKWQQVQFNFFLVFPDSVFLNAPKYFTSSTKTATNKESSELQQKITEIYPNIILIDFRGILETLQKIIEQLSIVIQFMGLFSIVTGLFVIFSLLYSNKYQRLKEMILVRTLGASAKQIYGLLFFEYTILGTISVIVATLLSSVSAFIILKFMFKISLYINWYVLISILLSTIVLTVLIGLLSNRNILNQSPLEALRES